MICLHDIKEERFHSTYMFGLSCRRVRQAERYNWAATRGVNEEMLLENLPEDLQREIRRHLFTFIKKVSGYIDFASDILLFS